MADTKKLLVIDDEISILEMIQAVFHERYQVYVANSGEGIVALTEQITPDAILLDIKMPKIDGYQVLDLMRKSARGITIPVLVLTAHKETVEKIKAFRRGADDFVTKPFEPDELSARIDSKIHRFNELRSAGKLDDVRLGNLSINTKKRLATVDGGEVDLTRIEFAILEKILDREGGLITREELIEAVYGDEEVSERVLDAHISSIRKKLADADYQIMTVYNSGYRLKGINPGK